MPASSDHSRCSHAGCTHAHHDHAHHEDHAHHAHGPDATRRIYVYSPSGAVQDRAAFRRGIKRLRQWGHHVDVDEAALLRHTRFAGDDATRIAAIHRAARSGADVALISRGGYGITRLLDQLDYALIARAIDQGTQFVGFSDFTALQLAVLASTGRVTWAGASLGVDFGAQPEPDEITVACFEDALYGVGEGTGWRVGKDSLGHDGLEVADATLWGGNLAVLTALVGTPHLPQVDDGILFLEDVGESPYRIERMLLQLEMAGILQRQQAVLMGQFTEARVTPHDRGFRLQTVIDGLRERLSRHGIPLLSNLPFGHVSTKVSLPVGAKVCLQQQGRDALLLWGHLPGAHGHGT
ncbi:LD-carboxypeptidase [Corticibacter populi]|uniref:LD-carboxypeptidase n=1 Tax=Corticibacter populi TaxID=1550736 RepID=A0A3M6QXA8_9BURK|nr:LD-carboxypeptidase [Corticibacter populi]RMX07638.1 LD-carboxypeptidase [Corticibacter populi]RZS30139.1 muramoyltetrapeptide carboxypeptidase [Corticibacter populi]